MPGCSVTQQHRPRSPTNCCSSSAAPGSRGVSRSAVPAPTAAWMGAEAMRLLLRRPSRPAPEERRDPGRKRGDSPPHASGGSSSSSPAAPCCPGCCCWCCMAAAVRQPCRSSLRGGSSAAKGCRRGGRQQVPELAAPGAAEATRCQGACKLGGELTSIVETRRERGSGLRLKETLPSPLALEVPGQALDHCMIRARDARCSESKHSRVCAQKLAFPADVAAEWAASFISPLPSNGKQLEIIYIHQEEPLHAHQLSLPSLENQAQLRGQPGRSGCALCRGEALPASPCAAGSSHPAHSPPASAAPPAAARAAMAPRRPPKLTDLLSPGPSLETEDDEVRVSAVGTFHHARGSASRRLQAAPARVPPPAQRNACRARARSFPCAGRGLCSGRGGGDGGGEH